MQHVNVRVVVVIVVVVYSVSVCPFRILTWRMLLVQAADTKLSDLKPLAMTVGKGVGGLLLLAQGNLIVWGLCFFLYRRWKQQQEDA